MFLSHIKVSLSLPPPPSLLTLSLKSVNIFLGEDYKKNLDQYHLDGNSLRRLTRVGKLRLARVDWTAAKTALSLRMRETLVTPTGRNGCT